MIEEKRIGVFICRCGNNIGDVVDVPYLVEEIKSIPEVVYTEENYYTCSEEGLNSIKNMIYEKNLNRVIVAACTPRTHEWLFQKVCEEAGLNKYLFEFVNIREQCSWIHSTEKEKATEKAKNLIKMGISKAKLLKPLKDIRSEIYPSALIIGCGIAGITAALNLANQGIQVHIVEKENICGGLLTEINKLYQTSLPASNFLDEKIKNLIKNRNINIHLKSQVKDVSGYIGNFEVLIQNEKKIKTIKAGVIIVATGALELKPYGLYKYKEIDGVITQLELEKMLKYNSFKAESVVVINCVGARNEVRGYCGRICCITSLKNSIIIKEMNPDTEVYILYRDIMAYGRELENYYKKARKIGINFIKYSPDNLPEISLNEETIDVYVLNEITGKGINLQVDYVILTTPLIPADDNTELSKKLKVPLTNDGFYLEAHQKLRPVEFANEGIYLCGTARYPSNITETVLQAYAAASKASIPVKKGYVETSGNIAYCDEELCSGCGNCFFVCPFEAISIKKDAENKTKPEIIGIKCRCCGLCVSVCPDGAMQQNSFSDKQILSMIKTMNE